MLEVKVGKPAADGSLPSQVFEEEGLSDDAIKKMRTEQNAAMHGIIAEAIVLKNKYPELLQTAIESIVNIIKGRIKIYTWADDNVKEMWVYDNGVYTTNGRCVIETELRSILGNIYDKYIVDRIIERIKVDTYISQDKFNEMALNHPYEINVNNGVIVIDPVTYDVTLEKHSPKKIFLWKLDWNYDISAKCPLIDKFLEDTLHVTSDRDALMESLGTTLQPHVITKKATISFGEADTGKSTANNLIHEFLGKKNCANLSLQQITEQPFLLCNLFGKIACIAGDLSAEEVKNIHVFKSLTGGDPQEGDRKYKNTVKFNNQSKFFFSMNKLPRLYNADLATWNRMMPFEYVRIFKEQKDYDALTLEDKKDKTDEELAAGKFNYGVKDPEMLKKMLEPKEMSGLLNKAIEGLIRYLQKGGFSYTRGVNEVREKWIRISDSFAAFCNDFIEQGDGSNDYITRKDLASRYNKYCKLHKIKQVGDKSMKATLSSEYGVVIDGYSRVPGSDERCWDGIKWKSYINGKLIQ